MTDVFIIGGGPAGLATAIAAARRGMKVVVADGNLPPVDKPCGEGLMPDSRRIAEHLGIDLPGSIGYEFRGIRFQGAESSVEADFPVGRGLGIRRTVLHEALIAAAENARVEMRWHTPVTDLDSIRARWIVGADGSSSRVRHMAGLHACRWNTRRYAYRQHFAIEPWTDFMEIHWGEGCQVYVTPVGASEVCVALISHSPDLRLHDALRLHFPALLARLAGRRATSKERGAITATVRLRAVARGNIALVGDASGGVDAITGEGICLGFKQAHALADALLEGDLSRYNRAHPRLALRPNLMARTMLMLDKGASLRRLALNALSAQPWIFRKLLAVHVWA